jgi:hypothetical protein
MDQKPSMGRVVIYNHPGSADGKYPPSQSPAIVMKVNEGTHSEGMEGDDTIDLFVMSNTGGIFFAKNLIQGDGPCQWSWPVRV